MNASTTNSNTFMKAGDIHPTIRVLAMPADTNAAGDIFGGWLMSQVDIAASVVARQRAQGRVVTVAVNNFQFIKPVYVGDLLSCYAEVVKIGRTSLTVNVNALVQRYSEGGEELKVAEAQLTFVAIDQNRRPRPVPNLDKE